MRRTAWLALGAIVLAGCSTTPGPDEVPTGNLWENGLAHHYETPPHVKAASGAKRDAGVAAPGSAEFAHIDEAMVAFMRAHDVVAGQLAIVVDGRLAYASGYGHVDRPQEQPTDESTMFRLASVTKPITRALVTLQVEEGLYGWDDPVFCIPPDPAPDCRLPIAPHPDHPIVDPRLADVRVGHLVDHTGGWGRSTDYLYRPEGADAMRKTFGFEGPPTAWQGAQYLMGLELADDPGTTPWYCNVCYMLLGLIAEAATGAHLQALYDAYLFRPLEIDGDIELGRALPEDRNPREPFYDSDHMVQSVYDPNETVRAPDGGSSMELISAGGGLVATADAVAAVYAAYPETVPPTSFRVNLFGNGVDVYGSLYEWRQHGGLLDGTSTIAGWAQDQHDAGAVVQYVALFNSHVPGTRCLEADVPPIGGVGIGCSMDHFRHVLLHGAVAHGAR